MTIMVIPSNDKLTMTNQGPLLRAALLILLTIGHLRPAIGQLTNHESHGLATNLTTATASEASRTTALNGLLEKPASINLRAIAEHQEALELECAKYHRLMVRQLGQLLKYQQQNRNQQLHLPTPLPIKVPAVCVFLSTKFNGLPESLAHAKELLKQPQKSDQPLDLVNWLYSEEDIQWLSSNASQVGGRDKRHIEPTNELLYNYFNDPSAMPTNELSQQTDAMVQYHKLVDEMLTNERYNQVIDSNRHKIGKHLSPVILVPGLLGSRLQGKVNKSTRVNLLCQKQTDWQDMWLSLTNLLPFAVDCWLDNVRLEHDASTGYTRQPEGVEVRVPDFGSVESVRHLDLRLPKQTRYFASIIERYEKLGYTADLNLLAAPYDFRLAPSQLSDYFGQLKGLVERAYDGSPSGRKATLVCHSMGCTHLLVFLRSQTADWRQQYVRKMIALSSPWGGSIKALKSLVVGDQLDLPLVSQMKMRGLSRTFPSMAFLLPQAEIFARSSAASLEEGGPVLVKSPKRSYKVADIPQLLNDLKLETQLKWYTETVPLIKPLEPIADLQVDCIHSLNTPTPETILFRGEDQFPDGAAEVIGGEGDGTVNAVSLMICDDWARMLPTKVKHRVIMNTNHLGVLSHPTTLTHLTDDVLTN